MLLTVSSPYQRNLTAYETVRSAISSSVAATSALERLNPLVVVVAGPSQLRLCGVRLNQLSSLKKIARMDSVQGRILDSNPFRYTSATSPTLVHFSTQAAVIGKFHSIFNQIIRLRIPNSKGSEESLESMVAASSNHLYNSLNASIVSGEFSSNTIFYSVSLLCILG